MSMEVLRMPLTLNISSSMHGGNARALHMAANKSSSMVRNPGFLK
jgi:hypothetical protein